jgi:acyl carrier protein
MSDQAETSVESKVRDILRDALGLSAERVAAFTDSSGLFGTLPELDSMAVAGLLTELEDRLGIIVDDDEIDVEMLESFGGLVAFAQRKVAG